MKIKVKDNIFNIEEYYDENQKFYSYKINRGDVQMGFINFKETSIYGKKCFWLYKIEVNEKYQHQGVGQALLYAMEYTALEKRIPKIMGKFYPSNEFAKPFYIKNDYYIYSEDNWELEKSLDFDKVKLQSVNYYVNEKLINIDRTC